MLRGVPFVARPPLLENGGEFNSSKPRVGFASVFMALFQALQLLSASLRIAQINRRNCRNWWLKTKSAGGFHLQRFA
jgi:hypothetical protein